MPRYQEPFGGTGEVATATRRDDRSGLLDIRALSSVIDAQRRARVSPASASSLALPTFTSPWMLQDVSAPPPTPSHPAPAPARPAADQRPLYVMIVALSAAVAGLAAYVALRPAPAVVVETTEVAVPSRLADVPEPPEPEALAVAGLPAEDEGESASEGEGEPAEAEPEAEPAEADRATEPKAKRPRAARTPRPPRTKPEPTAVTKPPQTKGTGTIPVECIIDPSQCSRDGTRKADPTKGDPASTKGLPATPSSSQIRAAMGTVKPQAKACGARHGGRDGDKVRVKLSVQGSTGAITSAKALDEHASSALGRCVAEALSKAELPRFSKPQAGVVYAVTL